MTNRLAKAAWPPLLLIAVHLLLLRALASMNVVHELLGTARPDLGLVALLGFFYLLRLLAFFVAPGWLVFRVVGAVRGVRPALAR